MPYDLDPVIRKAVVLFNGFQTGVFSTESFQRAVTDEFGLSDRPTVEWCERVLSGSCSVERCSSANYWRFYPAETAKGRR